MWMVGDTGRKMIFHDQSTASGPLVKAIEVPIVQRLNSLRGLYNGCDVISSFYTVTLNLEFRLVYLCDSYMTHCDLDRNIIMLYDSD